MIPKISVVTINYNDRKGLDKTIKSVISQDYENYEYIVIDGGSNDGSKTLIKHYNDKISYWESEPDRGIYNAMNKGILKAKGEYIIFINSGDQFYNDQSLKNGAKYLGNVDIIYSNLEQVDKEKKHIYEYPSKLSLIFFFQFSLPHPATFIRKSAFYNVGFFDEDLKIVSDWKWYLNAIFKYNLSYLHINEVISTFYLDGISSSKDNIQKIKQERKNTLLEQFYLSSEDVDEIITLKQNAYKINFFEHRFNHLKKYRIIKLLDRLGLIKILE